MLEVFSSVLREFSFYFKGVMLTDVLWFVHELWSDCCIDL